MEWCRDGDMVRVWLYLVFNAGSRDVEVGGTVSGRGQVVVSVRGLARTLGLSYQRTRTILGKLVEKQMITQSATQVLTQLPTQVSTQVKTQITICGYDCYECEESESQRNIQRNIQRSFQRTVGKTAEKSGKNGENGSENGQIPLNIINRVNSNNNIINKPDSLYKENKDSKKENSPKEKREKEKNEVPPATTGELILTGDDRKPAYDFVAPQFEKAFMTWLDYKRERKETYKSRKSLKVCYNHLVKMSGGSPDVAIAIVEQSMANNWAGLFELKTNNHHAENRKNREQERQGRMQEYGDVVARLIARARSSRDGDGDGDDDR